MKWRARLVERLRIEALPLDKYGHQPRLYELTLQVGAGLAYDDDVVFAAAWLHDLGVFIGHRPVDPAALARWDHVGYACARSPQILLEAGFDPARIAAVLEVIRCHQPKDDPQTIEGVILRDADILEQLGAIGILRAVAKTGRDTRYHTFTEAVGFLRKSLVELPPAIRLESTRAIAAPKIAQLSYFLSAVETESFGHLH